MRTGSYGDPAMEELAAARDSDELCRLLVQSPWGWDGDRAPATGRPSACFAGCAAAPSLARRSRCCCAGSAGPLWTGCVNSTGRKRRCATPGRTLIGRCALGARPARLHRRRRSCRALPHRSREGTRSCAGWLIVMCGAAILFAAKLRRPCNGCRPGGTRMRIAGRWRITEAELWDCDALNLVAPAFIEFAETGRRAVSASSPSRGRRTVARWSGRAAGCGVLLAGQR